MPDAGGNEINLIVKTAPVGRLGSTAAPPLALDSPLAALSRKRFHCAACPGRTNHHFQATWQRSGRHRVRAPGHLGTVQVSWAGSAGQSCLSRLLG